VISLEAVAYISCCNTVEWFWWDWSLSQWPTGFLQCFEAVGWVIWPVIIVLEMTYKVLSGTLGLYSLTYSIDGSSVRANLHCVWDRVAGERVCANCIIAKQSCRVWDPEGRPNRHALTLGAGQRVDTSVAPLVLMMTVLVLYMCRCLGTSLWGLRVRCGRVVISFCWRVARSLSLGSDMRPARHWVISAFYRLILRCNYWRYTRMQPVVTLLTVTGWTVQRRSSDDGHSV